MLHLSKTLVQSKFRFERGGERRTEKFVFAAHEIVEFLRKFNI